MKQQETIDVTIWKGNLKINKVTQVVCESIVTQLYGTERLLSILITY